MSSRITAPQLELLTATDWSDYELLDTGDGRKLERYGTFRCIRPEPEAMWAPALGEKDWQSTHAIFKPSPEENGGHWVSLREVPARWAVSYKGLKCWLQMTASRHLGVFPEQASQWDWIESRVTEAHRPVQVLNLFGYTGMASLAAARGGARVTHLDASRKVVSWGRENQELSGLGEKPIRWIVDDAIKFVEREGRRNNRYDGIILDPPKFGRGPKGEVWEFYRLIPELLGACKKIISDAPRFIVLTAYAVKASPITLMQALDEMMAQWQGVTTGGEVALKESSAGRYLAMAIYARWKARNG